jgi:hypothetical protein
LRATFVGVVIQIAMVVAWHFLPWLHGYYYLLALLMIAATAGYVYAADTGGGFFVGATAGAIVGGICGFVALLLTVMLHDIARNFIPLDTAFCVLTGAVGGLWGQVSANMKRAGW